MANILDDQKGTEDVGGKDPLLTDEKIASDLDSRWCRWKCLKCGFVYEGVKSLKVCPRCGNADPDQFQDVD